MSRAWIRSPAFDALWILSPPFLSVLLVAFYVHRYGESAEVSSLQWVFLILMVDVAHVYSTLFRTYFDRSEFEQRKNLYLLLPLGAWGAGCLLYYAGPLYFWRALAYTAVFHFVRQQYGFFRLYARHETQLGPFDRWLDSTVIYGAALWPILYWHTHLPRSFHWFVAGDFVSTPWPQVATVVCAIYLAALILYAAKECIAFRSGRSFNAAKHLVLIGTALSWYVGIVLFDGDLAFTATNTLSHGIPYLALVWSYERKKKTGTGFVNLSQKNRAVFPALGIFLTVVFVFAFLEEGLWDAFVWREQRELFQFFGALPEVRDPTTLGWLVPLLALPQLTHYLLDGFIWRLRGVRAGWLKGIEA